MRLVFPVILFSLLSGCSVVKNVQPVQINLDRNSPICVEVNPKVIEDDILSVIANGVRRNGYQVETYKVAPETCLTRIEYTARQKWDFTTFLSDADIWLYQGNKILGSVQYRTPRGIFGGGGANPEKWSSTESKISPLIDELFMLQK
ncbi:Sbal_3080 family lipoprotein [Vibrio fluvialis]